MFGCSSNVQGILDQHLRSAQLHHLSTNFCFETQPVTISCKSAEMDYVGMCLGVDRLHEKPHLAQSRPPLTSVLQP